MKIWLLLLAMLTFMVLSHAEQIGRTDTYNGYSGDIQLQLDCKLSSATTDSPYYVGKSTICIHIPEECRQAWIGNLKSSTHDIWYGYEQTISTMNATAGKVTPGNATWPIEPGQYLKLLNFMGNIYLLNDDKINTSSSTVIVQRWISQTDVR